MVSDLKVLIDNTDNKNINKLAVELAHITTLFNNNLKLPNIILSTEKEDNQSYIYIKLGNEINIESKDGGYIVNITESEKEAIIVENIIKTIYGIKETTLLSDIKTENKRVKTTCIADIFGPGLIKNRKDNYLVESSEFNLDIENLNDIKSLQASAALLSRISFDSQSLIYPCINNTSKKNILLKSSEKNYIGKSNDIIEVEYSEEDLHGFFKLLENQDITPIVKYFSDISDFNNIDGQYIFAKANEEKYEEIFIDKISKEKHEKLNKGIKLGLSDEKYIKSYKDEKLVFENKKTFEWEVDVLKSSIENEFYKIKESNESEDLIIVAAVSEDKDVRDKTTKELQDKLKEHGLTGDIKILNSYKQGYSWISEFVATKLETYEIDEIKIYFSDFSKEPGKEWTNESGSIPSYENMNLENKDKWFDLPIRLLQELYPIDDYLEENIDINRENITFHLLEDNKEDYRYEIEVYKNGEVIDSFLYRPVFSERLYLDEFPGMGLVHPSTAYYKIYRGTELIAFEKFNTDLENIWSYYQDEILAKTKDYIEEFHQPIFSTLDMEITVSETDNKLGYRQDSISSIDSFHEDLYFVGLDYFKLYSQSKFNKIIDAPGLILPKIHNKATKPNIDWKIYLPIDRKPFYIVNDEKIYLENKDRKIEIKSLEYKNGKKILQLLTKGISLSEISILKNIIENDASDIPRVSEGIDIFVIENENGEITEIYPTKTVKENSIENFDVKLNELYDYSKYNNSIEQLYKTEGVEIENLSRSYQGRMLHLIELTKKCYGFSTSFKKTNMKPTIYINARHHANEVSSTNSSFYLVKKLLSDKNLEDYLDKMNIVIIAMENTDGTEIHYELQKEHPEWIYHISRFNSLGKEFSHDYFKEDTIHTEALSLPITYKKWLPDIYIDDHGVPHHEWCQQFSGYTAPAYKGFWLPRALLYGYFWYREDHLDNEQYAKQYQESIANAFEKDEYSKMLNEDLKDRFKKYANSWLPNMFPADYYKDIIFYWIQFAKDSPKTYLSIMFPEVTTIGYTSEVADETSTGEYLEESALAHYRNNLAMLEVVKDKDIQFERSMYKYDNRIKIVNKRIRNK